MNEHYTTRRSASPPFSKESEAELFCSTCLKNQHLYTTSIAQYDVDWDTADPNYRTYEKAYFKWKRDLEKRYPQVCEDCEPKVQKRMQEAGRTAKSDYLGKLLSKSRAKKFNKKSTFSLDQYLMFAGKYLWYSGLLGQFIWSIMTIVSYILHTSPQALYLVPSSTIDLLDLVAAVTSSSRWANTSLYFSIASSWWNPLLKETARGFGRHITGTADWYRFQALMIISRMIFCYISGTGVLADPFSEPNVALHIFMSMFITLVRLLLSWLFSFLIVSSLQPKLVDR